MTAATPAVDVDRERQMLEDAETQGGGAKLMAWFKLSGPGWLQSAITLGGGSLAGSLFLGMIGGYSLLWLQVLAMAFGVVMLGAIGYVTLSTGERPFGLINRHVNPVLGWGWALATLAANIVWSLPQFSLAHAAVTQNLAPGLADSTGIVCFVILAIAVLITMVYDSGGKGLKIYENTLRIVVALIVLSFFGVVVKLFSSGDVSIGQIAGGFIPDLSMLSQPASTFDSTLAATGAFRDYWTNYIVDMQRDVMITAAATAVGINMTFLFPYSLLKKGWGRSFRGLSIFDLSTGMAIPFILATGCVVIASADRFHATPAPGLLGERDVNGAVVQPDPTLKGRYIDLLALAITVETSDALDGLVGDTRTARVEEIAANMPEGNRRIAAMLVKRDAKHLSASLAILIGDDFANYVFGFGVLAMALSTITILMLISGFTFCEVFGLPQGGVYHRIGCLLPAIGVLGPFVWKGKVAFWLAVPTSIFGMTLLPIAYFTFLLLMNNRAVLGDDLPKGKQRVIWNVLMGIACALASVGAGWAIWSKVEWIGVGIVVAFVGLAVIVHLMRPPSTSVPRATAAD
jgi:hypothetical protein